MSEGPIDSDRIADYPHPRETAELVGHELAERTIIETFASGRLAHAWLFAGPPGIGKATLAYRMARFLLRHGDQVPKDHKAGLNVDPNDPVARRIAAMSHGNLLVLRRPWDSARKRLKTVLTIDEVRRINNFFGLSAGEGGWRVCIIDPADDMNAAAGNALLKTLEEPPAKSILIVISHAPGRLLATIRSRCRRLNLTPPSEEQARHIVARCDPTLTAKQIGGLVNLAQNSPGRALALAQQGGLDIYADLNELLGQLPSLPDKALMSLSERLAKGSDDGPFSIALDLLSEWLRRMVEGGATGIAHGEAVDNEQTVMNNVVKLAPLDRWVTAWEEVGALQKKADALNLDRKQTILQAFYKIQKTCTAA